MKILSNNNDTALVLFSGGQDSTTCLAWALSRYARVETIGFDYGQRHAIELSVRPALLEKMRTFSPEWAARLGEDHMIDLSLISQLSHTAMTEDIAIEMQANGLPNTFVPGRNLMFMMVAATLAVRRGLNVLVGGMCETDFSGYPDCRPEYVKAYEAMANLATKAAVEGQRLTVHTPIIALSKADIIRKGVALGVDYAQTVSCYQATDEGLACGACDACRLRRTGFEQAAVADPTRYR